MQIEECDASPNVFLQQHINYMYYYRHSKDSLNFATYFILLLLAAVVH